MFDIKAIRDDPQAFDEGLKRRGIFGEGKGQFSSAAILKIDEERRAHVTKLQDAQARRNAASKEIGAAKKAKEDAKAEALMAEVAVSVSRHSPMSITSGASRMAFTSAFA